MLTELELISLYVDRTGIDYSPVMLTELALITVLYDERTGIDYSPFMLTELALITVLL